MRLILDINTKQKAIMIVHMEKGSDSSLHVDFLDLRRYTSDSTVSSDKMPKISVSGHG